MKRALILNMPDRLDRFQRTIANYPACLPEPERYVGITADDVNPPEWWRGGKVYASNRQNFIDLFDLASKADDLIYIFEDDVCFCDGFADKLNAFLGEVPDDWDVLYLGGEHFVKQYYNPVQVSPNVLRAYSMIRTHAMIARPETAGKIRDWLADGPWGVLHIADNRMAQFMMEPQNKVYCPIKFICGQRGAEKSTQCGCVFSTDMYFNWFMYKNMDGKLVGQND
ncbi:MAG: hypothetical protein IKS45_03730 [Thermoguttaceae bacterium]|nr:hypothetical protein [Thermoguttaceae bacterium]